MNNMTLEDYTKFTAKCFNGEPASCSFACPFHLDIRSFLNKTAKGRWSAAYKELSNAVVFPALVSVLCEKYCSARCQRSVTGNEAISLSDIEKAVVKYTKNRKPESYTIPPKTKTVAVVGAGAAGLSCALTMARKKYPVTVFDKAEGWGGDLRKHPRFQKFDEEFALQFSVTEVDFKFGKEIKALDALTGFDVIYIATGKGGESFDLLDSWNPDLLTTSNQKVFMGGGLCGDSLMDGIARAIHLSIILEVFLQEGKAAIHGEKYDKNYCGHYLEHKGAKSVPLVKAASRDEYTEEEAKLEASRCMQCDCELCMNACEMLSNYNKKPHRMSSEAAMDLQSTIISSRRMVRETYSCNLCGYCKSICPESVDLEDLLQYSRTDRIKVGSYPPAFHDYWMREMDFNMTEGFFASAPKGRSSCECAFFPGCQLGASNPDYVLKSYIFLKNKYDAGIIGDCCGAPAYWVGDEEKLKLNTAKIRQSWEEMGKPTLIFACATCETIFHKFLPEIKKLSLYELLAETEEIKPIGLFKDAAIFDPCNAREDHEMEKGVRVLAEKAGTDITELPEKNRCCSYGGLIKVANPKLYDEMAENRASESEKPYIVYCVNCREVFAGKGKECAHILDFVFNINGERKLPNIDEKRNNSIKVKKELSKEMRGIDYMPKTYEWDRLTLIVSDKMRELMEKKLIADSDLKEAIWLAETTGDKFMGDDGTRLSSMAKEVLTYWVQYRETGKKTYEILSAYTHRMRIGGEGRK